MRKAAQRKEGGESYGLVSKVAGLFRKPEEQAFPGDTYLEDMRAASKAGKPWASKVTIAIVLCLITDVVFLHSAVDNALYFQNKDAEGIEAVALSILTWLAAAALGLVYVYGAFVFGKKLKEYRAFGAASSRVSALLALLVLLLALIFITIFRLQTEDVSVVLLLTLMMTLSVYLSSVYAYYSGDSISEAVYRRSKAMLPADRVLFNKVFSERSNDIVKERDYEARERELDRRAVESAFKLGFIGSQLNGMVDPADAYEFVEARNALSSDYFK